MDKFHLIRKMLKRKFVEGYIIGYYEALQGLPVRYVDKMQTIDKWIAKKDNKKKT